MKLLKLFSGNAKKLAVLIDPEKIDIEKAVRISKSAQNHHFSFVFIGGSLVSKSIDEYIVSIKKACSLPVILFPGSVFQVSEKADGILFLSLISGRNPDYLIGQHVIASPILKKSGLSILPTGYVLIESGSVTSVEYMSNTKPIPSEKIDLVVATAIAGEMLGLKLIYLEGGSGAKQKIKEEVIKEVKKNISIPLIVGGGINTAHQLKEVFKAGADIAVVGTAIEDNPSLIKEFGKVLS